MFGKLKCKLGFHKLKITKTTYVPCGELWAETQHDYKCTRCSFVTNPWEERDDFIDAKIDEFKRKRR